MALWILGAPDPEMSAIEDLLALAGEETGFAVDVHGARVAPAGAYSAVGFRAAGPDGPTGTIRSLAGLAGPVYLVECDIPALPGDAELGLPVVVRVDHHRPGDPGFGRRAAEFWAASSIGQVADRLDVLIHVPGACRAGDGAYRCDGWAAHGLQEPDWARLRLVAAGDHCPGQAYRGKCPGVDPEALMGHRAAVRAAFQRRPVEAVLADVESAQAALTAHLVHWDQCDECSTSGAHTDCGRCYQVADMSRLPGGTVAELPEAALRSGVATLAVVTDRGGQRKLVLGGADPFQSWIAGGFLARAGRGNVAGWDVDPATAYGDPARGFAGATLR